MAYRKAIAHDEALLADDPANVKLLQKLGETYQKAGEPRKAAEAYARLADCCARDGFFLKSIALLKQVLKLDSNRNDLRFRLADLHLEIGLQAEAVAYLHQGLEHAHRDHDVDGCLAASGKLVEVEPERPGFRLYLAHLLLWAGRKDDARGEILEAARLLRSAHPDLAARAEAIERGLGHESTSSELPALKALRLELYERSTLERNLMALDFSAPN